MPLPQAIGSVPLFSHAPSIITPSSTRLTNGGACNPHTCGAQVNDITNIPLPTTATNHKAQPLILSSALPPVSTRVVKKIRTGAFVDLKDLVSDNVALLQRLQETNPGTPQGFHTHVRDSGSPHLVIMLYVVRSRMS